MYLALFDCVHYLGWSFRQSVMLYLRRREGYTGKEEQKRKKRKKPNNIKKHETYQGSGTTSTNKLVDDNAWCHLPARKQSSAIVAKNLVAQLKRHFLHLLASQYFTSPADD